MNGSSQFTESRTIEGDNVSNGTTFHYTFDNSVTGICQVSCAVVATPDDTDSQSTLAGEINWTIDIHLTFHDQILFSYE